MSSEERVVAIDGPAGSGKSTVARELARRLNLDYLDTGAMYRSVAFAALQRGIDPEDREPVARLAQHITMDIGNRVLVDGYDATIEIRGPEVTRAVSTVAANPDVRAELRDRQRAWAEVHGGGVVEGRDIGSVVFPHAALKVYLTAADDERARRRHKEVTALHYDASSPGLAVEAVQADMARRDHLDSTRAASPLAVAEDAVILDTTGRSIDEIVDDVMARLPAGITAGSPSRPGREDAPDGRHVEGDRPPVSAPPDEGGRPGDGRDIHGAYRPEDKGRAGRAFDRFLYWFCRGAIHLFARGYWRLTIRGAENLPASGPYVVAPVHRSNIDTPLVGCITTRRLRFMGKDSLWKHRASARFLSALGGFPVHRGSADRDALRRCIEVIAGGEPLVLFPEGTRQAGPLVQELFEGAAYVATRTGVPIVPVGIGGSERAMPKGAKGLRPVRIAIVVGRPLYPEERDDGRRGSRRAVKELTQRLHEELQALFDAAQVQAGA
jgi:cytidylate kinase